MSAADVSWMADALCAQTDPDLFLPDGQGTNNATAAKKICAQCDVIEQCLAWALATGAEGTLGGMSEKERKKILGPKRAGHGSDAMYRKGCKDETQCPGNVDGRTCSQAHRDYQNKWEARKRANGGRAA
jgi:WhiB family redox-sensing transcriptional regulator